MYSLAKLSLQSPLILPQVGHVINIFVNLTAKETIVKDFLFLTISSDNVTHVVADSEPGHMVPTT